MSDEEANAPVRQEEILSLGLLLTAFWFGRRVFLVSMGIGLILASLYLTLLSRPIYEASALIGPSQSVNGTNSQSTSGSVLSSLIGAGMGASSGEFEKFMQVLTSARLGSEVEARFGLMHQMMGSWDANAKTWRQPTDPVSLVRYTIGRIFRMPAWQPPSSPEYAQLLSDLVKTESLSGRSGGGLTRVTVTAQTPAKAVDILFKLLKTSDDLMRRDRAENSSNRVQYLTAQLDHTTDLTLRQNLQNILLHEQQSLMVLNADKFFSFDMLDPPAANTEQVAPHPLMLLVEAAMAGALIGAVYIFMLVLLRFRRGENPLQKGFPVPFLG